MKAEQCMCGCGVPNHIPQQDKLDVILMQYKEQKGNLIPVLQEVQKIYGYLPKDVLIYVAEVLKTPLSQVYGVATFYSQFHLYPRGRNIVRVCQGTACHVRGAAAILDEINKQIGIRPGETTEDFKFTMEQVACVGACGLAPVMMINDDTHGRLTPGKIKGILEKYK